ncbi:LysR family transcriptional regulator [Denitrobacterium detoxificans]|uniref:LysR family transcriptional regulator n=1 Tax=Denitrobacterium detoxificans TaxID=79604 RepID=UPI0026F18F29|nr:LysR family transcriptional regulator [Denitrobacterium detoxificans]MBE6466527.1 LysR family transcriptional regulator [Denitrobacterium detoxificans]
MNQKYEAFVKAAETGSFKAAAEELGYTQAGISYIINALENEMGTSLFIRDHAGARLTPDGRALLPWVQDVCNAERALQTRLDDVRHVEGGTVRISAFASIAIHWLPHIIREFQQDHPNVEFDIAVYEEQDAQEATLWHGEYDCGFLVLPTSKHFFTIPLAQDPMYFVVAKDHPLANADFFPTEAMESEPYIKVRNDTHTEMDALFENHNVKPHVKMEIDNDYAVMAMVNQGLGYGLFPQLLLRDMPYDLAMLEPEIPMQRQVAIAVRSYEKASIAAKAFIECTRNWIGAQQSK